MKLRSSILLGTGCLLAATGAWAGDDCHTPMADWKPREAVTAHVTQLGITTERLRMDDGCYEVRGRDADGNRVELKLEPGTLNLIKLEVRFRDGAGASRYLPRTQAGVQPGNLPNAGRPQGAAATPVRANQK